MKSNKRKRAKEIQNNIRQILFNDWDPIGINDNSNCFDEYDSYIGSIYKILASNRSEKELVECLFYFSEDLFGYDSKGNEIPNKCRQNLKPIMQNLLEIDVQI